MPNNNIKLLAVVGPTAVGKSGLALRLCECYGGELVSCDSMQVYRGMDIGTAKPTKGEQERVRHHMIDTVDADKPFSCAEYVRDAAACIEEITARGRLPILCGGTGLYLDALLRGGLSEEPEVDPALREELLAYAREQGNEALHKRLEALDPESAATIHPNNVKRVARAIEICLTLGGTKSAHDRATRERPSPYDALVIGLGADRPLLYERIERRVDTMLAEGLLDETRRLVSEGVFETNGTAAQAIGYKELLGYLRGEEPFEEAVLRLKTATRRYAKRQLTWFGAKDYVHWLAIDHKGTLRPSSALLEEAAALIDPFLCERGGRTL